MEQTVKQRKWRKQYDAKKKYNKCVSNYHAIPRGEHMVITWKSDVQPSDEVLSDVGQIELVRKQLADYNQTQSGLYITNDF